VQAAISAGPAPGLEFGAGSQQLHSEGLNPY
jgi:hypothetical protein